MVGGFAVRTSRAITVMIVGAVVTVAACSSSNKSTTSTTVSAATTSVAPTPPTTASPGLTPAATPPTPGHDSPAAATTGLLQAIAASDFATACGYAVPQQQNSCNQNLGQALQQQLPGPTIESLTAPTTVMSPRPANRAIVVV